ncbi:MAG: hypothetical protein M3Q44_01260 [bacterium]|nr:hypothetical protein [bacterium]
MSEQQATPDGMEDVSLREAKQQEQQGRTLLGSEKIGENDNVYNYPPFKLAFDAVLGKEYPTSGRTIREELQSRINAGLPDEIRAASTDWSHDIEGKPVELVRYMATTVAKDMPLESEDSSQLDVNKRLITFKSRLRNKIKGKPIFSALGHGDDALGTFLAQQIITELHASAPYFVQYLNRGVDFKGSYQSSGYPKEGQAKKFPPKHYFSWCATVINSEIKIQNLDARQAAVGMGFKKEE